MARLGDGGAGDLLKGQAATNVMMAFATYLGSKIDGPAMETSAVCPCSLGCCTVDRLGRASYLDVVAGCVMVLPSW